MFNLRRTYAKTTTLAKLWARRNFTTEVSMFKPVATALDVPASEILNNLQDTHAMTQRNEERFEEYNKMANQEYDEMIQNRMNKIIGSNNVSDWELAEDNGFLRKVFEFDSSEHAHIFINDVSFYCSRVDHHPEWKMIGDRTIEVSLTSHFADNKVSINDYELAQEMNKIASKNKSKNPYATFTLDKLKDDIFYHRNPLMHRQELI